MNTGLLAPIVFALIGAPLASILPRAWRPYLLLALSLGFYASFNWRFLFLLLAIIGLAYAGAQLIARRRESSWIAFAVHAAILTPLLFYKYLLELFAGLRDAVFPISSLDFGGYGEVLIPVGLSFFTFQCLGYLIEVRRGYFPPEKRFVHFALFASFFPLLLSGPIERWRHLAPQLERSHRPTPNMVLDGLMLIAWGLFLKSVVGDRLGTYVDAVYLYPVGQAAATAAVAVVAFTLQLFADFAGYTMIALGAAKLFGIEIVPNFRQPLFAASIADFWQRWHMSLTRWIGDFVYRPLALRLIKIKSLPRPAQEGTALLVTWLTMGLWHGASWTFVVFGCAQAILIYGHTLIVRGRRSKPSAYRAVAGWIVTMAAVVITFGIIRSQSVGEYLSLLGSAVSLRPGLLSFPDWEQTLCALLVVAAVEAARRFRPDWRLDGVASRATIIGALVLAFLLYGYEQSKAFIYFRF